MPKPVILLFCVALAACPGGAHAADRHPLTGDLASLGARAEKGDAQAQDHLGWAFHQGIGVAQDDAEALRWLHKAARQKKADAEYHLALLYEYGEGTAQNFPEAFKWFRKAAEQGSVPGQMALADMYAQGWGTRQDKSEAYFWYLVAARSGDPVAIDQRNALQSRLDPSRLPGLLKRAIAWRPVPQAMPRFPPRRHSWKSARAGGGKTLSQ